MIRSRTDSLRISLSLLLAAIIVLTHAGRAPQPAALAAANPQSARSALRIGVWTLWHDRQLLLKPANNIVLRTCDQCPALSLSQPADFRAQRDTVTIVQSGKQQTTPRISLTGPITLTAHGETITIRNPVSISARNGALIIAVTLPIESYV